MDDQEIRDRLNKETKNKLTFSPEDRAHVFRKIEQNGKRKRGFSTRFRKAVPVFATIAFLILAVGILLPSVLSNDPESMLGSNESEDPFTVLLLGKDANERIDANVLVSYNPEHNSAKLVSIPRDVLVQMENQEGDKVKKDKFLHSYGYGGIETTVATASDFLDVPIDYYAMVDMKGFVELIDSMGGMDFEITYSQKVKGLNGTVHEVETGIQHLSGDELLAVLRERYTNPEGGIHRQKEHLKFVQSFMQQSIENLNSSEVKDLLKNVETNLPVEKMIQLLKATKDIPTVKTLNLSGGSEPVLIDGIYYLKLNENSVNHVTEEIKTHLNPEK